MEVKNPKDGITHGWGGVATWNVAFYGRAPWYWRWLVGNGFRHCSAFGYAAFPGVWVFVEPGLCGLRVQFADQVNAWRRIELLVRAKAVILAGPRLDPRARHVGPVRGIFRFAPWCVAVVVSVIGSGSRALRPFGLFRDLLRDGWTYVFDTGPDLCGARDAVGKDDACFNGGADLVGVRVD